MKKSEEKELQLLVSNYKSLSEKNKSYIVGLTEGMTIAGGDNNGKESRR